MIKPCMGLGRNPNHFTIVPALRLAGIAIKSRKRRVIRRQSLSECPKRLRHSDDEEDRVVRIDMRPEEGVLETARTLRNVPSMRNPVLYTFRLLGGIASLATPKLYKECMNDEGGEPLAHVGVNRDAEP